MVSVRKFRIIVLVSNRIEYWSNYSIRFEISNICTALLKIHKTSQHSWQCPAFTNRFSLLMSRMRRPLRSRHASRLVVFSICAPIDRSIDPNPSYTDSATRPVTNTKQ